MEFENKEVQKVVIDGAGKMYPFYDMMDSYNKKALDIMVCQGTDAAKKYLNFISMKNASEIKK